MPTIFSTPNFILETHPAPEVDRLDGGHLKISPKVPIKDRTELTPAQAKELVRFTMLAGEAFTNAMAARGIPLGRINYQDNGNWRHEFHLHLYGRALDAKFQKFGNPIVPGHQPEYQPLNDDDIAELQKQITILENSTKYKLKNW